jgi:type IV pilus assembly protein PilA
MNSTMNSAFSLRRMRGNILLGPGFFAGILAAIAIPAYQDYTLRARVTEGLNLAGAVKASVAEAFATSGKWPRDLRALRYDAAPRGKYVTFVAVNHGTVVIRYSQSAGSPLARQQVTLRPTVDAQGNILWSCGYSGDQGSDPDSGAASPHATSLAPKYLPSTCRG